jgi:hypothetical protein
MAPHENPHVEEIQKLAKSVLARQVRDVIDQPGIPSTEKIKHIRDLIAHHLSYVPPNPPEKKLAGLAKNVLAFQISDIFKESHHSLEAELNAIRSHVEHFIINP